MLCWSIFNHSLKTFSRNKCKAYWPALPQAPGGGSAPGTRLAARRSRGCVTVEADQQKVSPPPFVILSHLMGSVWGSQVVFMIKGGGNMLTIIAVIVQLPTAGALSPVPRTHTPHLGGTYALPSALWPGFLLVQPSRDLYLPFLPSVLILSYFQSLGGHHIPESPTPELLGWLLAPCPTEEPFPRGPLVPFPAGRENLCGSSRDTGNFSHLS